MPELRRGVRLALDWGKARIGVAACDRDGVLSHPVTTIASHPTQRGPALAQIQGLVSEYEPVEVILGMPIDLQGRHGQAAQDMAVVADELCAVLEVPLRVVDERLSSASAARKLSMAGRDSKARRGVIDMAAAVDILEYALETERRSGQPAGRLWGKEGRDE